MVLRAMGIRAIGNRDIVIRAMGDSGHRNLGHRISGSRIRDFGVQFSEKHLFMIFLNLSQHCIPWVRFEKLKLFSDKFSLSYFCHHSR